MHQVGSCGIGKKCDLHNIQICILLVFVHENFVSQTVMSQTVNIFLSEYLFVLVQP